MFLYHCEEFPNDTKTNHKTQYGMKENCPKGPGSNNDALHFGMFIIVTIVTVAGEWLPRERNDTYEL